MRDLDIQDERRVYQRVKVNWPTRVLVNGEDVFMGHTMDVSASGVAITMDSDLEIGDKVVCYLDRTDRISGEITRTFDGGFAIHANLRPAKSKQLVAKLMWHMNKEILDNNPDIRSAKRKSVSYEFCDYMLADGSKRSCKVKDLSVLGAFIESKTKPDHGSMITIGKMICRVVRVTEEGFAIEFDRADSLGESWDIDCSPSKEPSCRAYH